MYIRRGFLRVGGAETRKFLSLSLYTRQSTRVERVLSMSRPSARPADHYENRALNEGIQRRFKIINVKRKK